MPIYEYQCKDCDYSFEQLIRNQREEKALKCPKCPGKVERQLSVFAARSQTPPPSLPTGGGCGCGNPMGPCNQ